MPKKIAYEDLKHYVEIESGSQCILLSNEYVRSKGKLKFKCRCGNIFETTYESFKYRKKWLCNNCSIIKQSKGQLISYDDVENYIENNSGCKLLSKNYIGIKDKMLFQCLCGNVFKTSYEEFKRLNKRQCNDCGNKSCSEKNSLTYDEVKTFVEDGSNSGCIFLSKEYKNRNQILEFLCPCGNKFSTNFNTFKHTNKRHCDECGEAIRLSKKRIPFDEIKSFIEGYNCKLVTEDFPDIKTPLKIMCQCGNYFYKSFDVFKKAYFKTCDMCTKTKMSHGEHRIVTFLKENKLDFEYEKKYKNLVSDNNIRLSYDFYISKFNCLIEYQGGFHEKPVAYGCTQKQAEKNFKKQKEHDRRKKQYANNNNINLLEIWYWDFDNIEEILNKELLLK